jgi:tRNA A-37 threonylcarbamoyl transferase component Bud32
MERKAQADNRRWGAVPDGFQKLTMGRRRMIVRTDVAHLVQFDLDDAQCGEPSQLRGRQALTSMILANGDRALVRRCHHGGAFRFFTRGLFCSCPPRPFRELVITEELRRRGIPTIEVYGACAEPVFGPFYKAWLISRELAGSQDLWTALQDGIVQTRTLESVLRPVAQSIRHMHRQGVYHSDLNLKNILVRPEPQGVKSYIIDFDKAKLFLSALPEPLAQNNLRRLWRSLSKLDPERKYLSAKDWDRFLNWYHECVQA